MERSKMRTANYTVLEKQLLTKLTNNYRSLLENDLVSLEQKSKIWQAIQTQFNKARNVFPRTAKQLKSKYETMRRETEKRAKVARGERFSSSQPQNVANLVKRTSPETYFQDNQADISEVQRRSGSDIRENIDPLRYVKVRREQPSTSSQQTSVPTQNNTLADLQRISLEKAMENEHKRARQLEVEHELRMKNLKLKHEVLSLKKEVLESQLS